MDAFDRIKPMGLLVGILLIIFGVIFLAAPDRVAEFLAVFVGAVITAFGLFRIIVVITRWNLLINRVLMLTLGIIIFAIGLFMLFNPEITITVIGAIIGVFAILMAVDRFITANRIKGEMNILPTIISGLIHLAFGVGMIYSAIITFSIIIIIAGIYLLIAGIMIVLSTLLFRDF